MRALHCETAVTACAKIASSARTTRFLRSLVPLPQPRGHVVRQSMTQLTRQHHDLTSMVALVRDEVGQDMRDVQRQVAPDVALRRRHVASCRATLRRSTEAGMAIPCSWPSVLTHVQRALWRCPAIIRTVRRGAPGTAASHSAAGRCSTRYEVTRLLVRQDDRRVALRSASG